MWSRQTNVIGVCVEYGNCIMLHLAKTKKSLEYLGYTRVLLKIYLSISQALKIKVKERLSIISET